MISGCFAVHGAERGWGVLRIRDDDGAWVRYLTSGPRMSSLFWPCGPAVAERLMRDAAYAYLLPPLLLPLLRIRNVVYSYIGACTSIHPFSATAWRHQIAVGPRRLYVV